MPVKFRLFYLNGVGKYLPAESRRALSSARRRSISSSLFKSASPPDRLFSEADSGGSTRVGEFLDAFDRALTGEGDWRRSGWVSAGDLAEGAGDCDPTGDRMDKALCRSWLRAEWLLRTVSGIDSTTLLIETSPSELSCVRKVLFVACG